MRIFLPMAVSASLSLPAQLSGESYPASSAFFGFEFVLVPVAIKWACGGESSKDLAALDALIDAFPSDAQRDDLQQIIDLLRTTDLDTLVTTEIGVELARTQLHQLCEAALPLSLDWITPEGKRGNKEDAVKAEHFAAYENFYYVVEGFHLPE
ncbi:hypothetical protein [uncultured Ruegeria sp.]|uniref:hypothetical protein n=1 Tax=uncultured Ruegeria sp. TaxID=259304 RepID=UPI0026280831|nr:hypothetical protein [uncultured Ruegeria sp.]